MSSLLDSAYARDASLGPYYNQKLRATLTDLWRHKLLIMATVAASLGVGIALALIMPKSYTAEVYLRGGFEPEEAISTSSTSLDRTGSTGSVITLDASMLAETRSRLLQSQLLAQRVVQRLGLERIRPAVSQGDFSSWLQAEFYGNVTSAPEFKEAMAARTLARHLSVKTEPRVYLIVLRYTAVDPELAALIANAFVVEFLRDGAERTLSRARATLGEKHPKVIEARTRLQAVDALLRNGGTSTGDIERTSNRDVTFAQPNAVPSSPDPKVLIGVSLLVGLVGGIAMAAFRGRS